MDRNDEYEEESDNLFKHVYDDALTRKNAIWLYISETNINVLISMPHSESKSGVKIIDIKRNDLIAYDGLMTYGQIRNALIALGYNISVRQDINIGLSSNISGRFVFERWCKNEIVDSLTIF